MVAQDWIPRPGECLLIDSGPTGKHLFVLVCKTTDGKGEVVISAPVCSVKDAVCASVDDACLISAGEHVFVRHDSFIEYRHCRIDSPETILNLVRKHTFLPKEPVTPTLLAKIKEGLLRSRHVKRYIRELLKSAN